MTTIPQLPLLAPWYRVVGDGERLLLEYAQSLVVLEGEAVRTLLPALLPLLDGRTTLEELSERLGPPARPAIEAAVRLLAERGVVVEGAGPPEKAGPAALALAAAHGLPPAVVAERVGAASVGIAGAGSLGFEIARMLSAAGVGNLRRCGWNKRGRADLTVVVPATDEWNRLDAFNRVSLRAGCAWLPVRPFDGAIACVGPLILPGQTCCYECVLLRRAANSGYLAEFSDVETAPLAATAEAGVDTFTAALAAHVAVRWIAGRDTTLPGALFTLETRPDPGLGRHLVLRVPRCRVCSPVARTARLLPWHEVAA